MDLQIHFRILLAATLCVTVSCKNDSGSTVDEIDVTTERAVTPYQPPQAGSLNGDTLNIMGKFVLFFGPVETADSTQKLSASELQSFKQTGYNLIDSLSVVNEIKAMYSTASIFRVFSSNGNIMVITKSALNTEAGMLISDGSQPPTIKKGVLSQSVYRELIQKYFLLQ